MKKLIETLVDVEVNGRTIDLDKARKILELSLSEYSAIRATYWSSVYDAVYSYLSGSGSIVSPRNSMQRAMSDAVFAVGPLAWVDGGSELPLSPEAFNIVQNTHSAELVNISTLFDRLRSLRSELDKDEREDTAISEATARADGYCGTLDFLYSQVKLLGTGDRMLTFVGIDGKSPFPCPECRRYKNKRHRASWWVSHDAIPGSVTGFTCKGYQCKHVLVDDNGMIYTL